MKRMLLVAVALMLAVGLQAQTPVGKWKLTGLSFTMWDGSVRDDFPNMMKEEPCMEYAEYHFLAGGKLTGTMDKCPTKSEDFPSEVALGTSWKHTGATITLRHDDPELDPVVYNVEFKEKTMILNFLTPRSSNVAANEDVKAFTLRFTRL